MADFTPENTDAGLSRPLTERERRISQRAYIIMAVTGTVAGTLAGTSSVLGVFFKRLGVTGPQLGGLVALATPFGIIGLLLSGLAIRIGRKRMMGAMTIPVGLATIGLLVLPALKERSGEFIVLVAAWGLLATRVACNSVFSVPWFPVLQMITLPGRRGAFIGRMRLAWALASVVLLVVVARFLGQQANTTLLMVLIGIAGLLNLSILVPLQFIFEHRADTRPRAVGWAEAWQAIRTNRLYLRTCLADALIAFGQSMFVVFQLYFLTQSLGWADGAAIDVLWITMVGLGISNMFWGLVADRVGDKAVAQLACVGMAVSALCWVAAGNTSVSSVIIIVMAAFGQGVFHGGIMMSLTRVLLNHVPERVSPVLLAVRSVCVTLAVTAASALGGLILKSLQGWHWSMSDTWRGLDGYKVLFLLSAVVYLIVGWLTRKFPAVPGRTSWTILTTMFNWPFQTVRMFSRIELPLPEQDRLSLVRRLSQSANPLAFEGLVGGLTDPSYDVRLASVTALASRPGPQSFEALIDALYLPELDIQPEAVWVLGEVGDERAVPILMSLLGSPSQLLRGRAARALGKLRAVQAAPIFHRMLTEDADSFVRRSAAVALARLKVKDSLGPIFEQFQTARSRLAQRELALALANLVYDQDLYYRLRHSEARQISAVLTEAIDEAIEAGSLTPAAEECMTNMAMALAAQDLQQVRLTAIDALADETLTRPSGLSKELLDYLLAGVTEQRWTDEHAGLLIFLLLQTSAQRMNGTEY